MLAARTRLFSTLFASVLGLSFAAPASAASKVDAKAAAYNTAPKLTNFGNSDTSQIAEGLFLRRINSDVIFVGVSDNDPFHGVTGSCYGTALVRDSKLSGEGYCSLNDSDGQSFAIKFAMKDITSKKLLGSWRIIGGQGKWAGANGSGDWTQTIVGANNMSIAHLTGNIDF
ncbi:hypothetical protein [Polycladidibacter hongkongensis]|uniref:hypothetical protein n=1 Tax=Polycladidibacter hongkongensis TaxID=1647556 RepID=UPI00083156FF|nr:hypothetical protein [Pseudovibrio hongkongensis]